MIRQSPRGAGRQLLLRAAERNVKAGFGIPGAAAGSMERLRGWPPQHKPHRVLGVTVGWRKNQQSSGKTMVWAQ